MKMSHTVKLENVITSRPELSIFPRGTFISGKIIFPITICVNTVLLERSRRFDSLIWFSLVLDGIDYWYKNTSEYVRSRSSNRVSYWCTAYVERACSDFERQIAVPDSVCEEDAHSQRSLNVPTYCLSVDISARELEGLASEWKDNRRERQKTRG